MKTVCIYHKNCFDGICSAWVVSQKYPDAEFIPAQYGDQQLINNIIQDCFENANINDHYIIVDFSFKRELMIQLANKVKSIIVLDHHKTAEKELEGLNFAIFDMNESGASLAWKHFFPESPIPDLVRYIADRDLWKFQLPNSSYVNSYIQSFPMTLQDYEYLHDTLEYSPISKIVDIGKGIERYKQSMTESMCKNLKLRNIGSYIVPTINATLLFSEVGHELAESNPDRQFAASYFFRNDGKVQWSLRSIGDFDVSEVAKQMGGGGHKNAAGFESDLQYLIERI